MKIRIIKKKNNKDIGLKPLKSLSQEVKDLMDGIEDVNKDINVKRLAFIGSNREKFNFNKFRMALNSLSSIYNSQITLKRQNFFKKIYTMKQMS